MVCGRRWACAALVVPVALLAGCSGSQDDTSGSAGPDRATIETTTEVDARTVDLQVASDSVGTTVPVRLLLPAGYESEPDRTWPVLYLLHGCCDVNTSWTDGTQIAELSRDVGVIVALPEGGPVGFYSDWLDGPGWETFHTEELPALLAEEYRASGEQAVAGLSMGGLGALGYAARHPGEYAAVASYSGIAHTLLNRQTPYGYQDLVRFQGEDPDALWGDPEDDVEVWREHNPFDLAEGLTDLPVYVSCGNGQPGPLDAPGRDPDGIEASLLGENEALVARLQELGADLDADLYGPGTHDWPYWDRALADSWPMFVQALGLAP